MSNERGSDSKDWTPELLRDAILIELNNGYSLSKGRVKGKWSAFVTGTWTKPLVRNCKTAVSCYELLVEEIGK